MIQQQIKDQVRQAMLAKETLKLNTLRGLLSGFTNELVAQKKTPREELSDEDAMKVIKRAVKQRKDSIEQFRKGNREDLAQIEESELKILEVYLPEMMSVEDIEKKALAKKEELGITDKSKMGILMGALMKDLKDKADGQDVKEVIEKLFS